MSGGVDGCGLAVSVPVYFQKGPLRRDRDLKRSQSNILKVD